MSELSFATESPRHRAARILERLEEIRTLRGEIKATRAEMKRLGIRRMSFMNGGHSPESYRLNALMFRLETELASAERSVNS